jgi:hypothetical protein
MEATIISAIIMSAASPNKVPCILGKEGELTLTTPCYSAARVLKMEIFQVKPQVLEMKKLLRTQFEDPL